jgi:hypothetical protein
MLHTQFSIARSPAGRAWRKASTLGVSGVMLLGALSLVPLTSAQGQTTVNYGFEDGLLRGDPTQMKVPSKIVTESGNHFMRITGSTGDCESLPSDKCPPRNRSTVRFTTSDSSMPLISEATMRQTYSAKMRFKDNTGTDGVVLELYQSAPTGSTSYGTKDGKGPVVICWRTDGRVKCRANYANETQWDSVDLGAISAGTWHTYMVKAVWSHDPSQGRIEIYLDGTLKKKITGRDANLGSTSNRIPTMKLGLYGDNAVGVVEVDQVKAFPTPSPSSPVALNAPSNLRAVNGQ